MIRRAAYKQVIVIHDPSWQQPPQYQQHLQEVPVSPLSPSLSPRTPPAPWHAHERYSSCSSNSNGFGATIEKDSAFFQVPIHLIKRQRAVLIKDIDKVAPEFETVQTERGTVIFSRREGETGEQGTGHDPDGRNSCDSKNSGMGSSHSPSSSATTIPSPPSSTSSSAPSAQRPQPAFIGIHDEDMENGVWYVYAKAVVPAKSFANNIIDTTAQTAASPSSPSWIASPPTSMMEEDRREHDPQEMNSAVLKNEGPEENSVRKEDQDLELRKKLTDQEEGEDDDEDKEGLQEAEEQTRFRPDSAGQSTHAPSSRSLTFATTTPKVSAVSTLSSLFSVVTGSPSQAAVSLLASGIEFTIASRRASSSINTVPQQTEATTMSEQLVMNLARTLLSVLNEEQGFRDEADKARIRDLATEVLKTYDSSSSAHPYGLRTPEATPVLTPMLGQDCDDTLFDNDSRSENEVASTRSDRSGPMLQESVSHFSTYSMSFPSSSSSTSLSSTLPPTEATFASSTTTAEPRPSPGLTPRALAKNKFMAIFGKSTSNLADTTTTTRAMNNVLETAPGLSQYTLQQQQQDIHESTAATSEVTSRRHTWFTTKSKRATKNKSHGTISRSVSPSSWTSQDPASTPPLSRLDSPLEDISSKPKISTSSTTSSSARRLSSSPGFQFSPSSSSSSSSAAAAAATATRTALPASSTTTSPSPSTATSSSTFKTSATEAPKPMNGREPMYSGRTPLYPAGQSDPQQSQRPLRPSRPERQQTYPFTTTTNAQLGPTTRTATGSFFDSVSDDDSDTEEEEEILQRTRTGARGPLTPTAPVIAAVPTTTPTTTAPSTQIVTETPMYFAPRHEFICTASGTPHPLDRYCCIEQQMSETNVLFPSLSDNERRSRRAQGPGRGQERGQGQERAAEQETSQHGVRDRDEESDSDTDSEHYTDTFSESSEGEAREEDEGLHDDQRQHARRSADAYRHDTSHNNGSNDNIYSEMPRRSLPFYDHASEHHQPFEEPPPSYMSLVRVEDIVVSATTSPGASAGRTSRPQVRSRA